MLGYVSYARGFNSGNYNGGALFNQSEATLVDPEKLNAYEIGIKSELADGTVRLNADIFYYDFKDQQAFILASNPGGAPFQQLSNAAASTLYGAEAELVWKPVEALLLQGGVGYTHSKFDEFNSPAGGDLSGNELPSAPEWNFNLMARYEWQLSVGTLAISADTKYTDDQFFGVNNDPLLAQDAYWLSNARIEFASRTSLVGRGLGAPSPTRLPGCRVRPGVIQVRSAGRRRAAHAGSRWVQAVSVRRRSADASAVA